MPITQTVEIPDSRRFTVEVPRETPTGRANIVIFPVRENTKQTAIPPEECQFDSVNGQIRIKESEAPKINPVCGCAKGQFWMADDFCEPLEDFKDYM